MPNYCNNDLTIKSDNHGLLSQLMQELTKDTDNQYNFLSMLVPFTAETNYEWDYDWCVANWGTKWDIFDVFHASLDGDTLNVSFMTAWSPPVEALVTAAERLGISFELYYEEGGAGFAGKADNGGDAYFETYTDHDPRKYIDADILDTFPHIEEQWDEWQEEKKLEAEAV